jgi:hypothetical protein
LRIFSSSVLTWSLNQIIERCEEGTATYGHLQGCLMVTLDKGPRRKVWKNQALLLVKSCKLVPRPFDKGPGPRQIKLWFSLHGIILEGKLIRSDQKKELKWELMVWRTKVLLISSFFFGFLLHLLLKICEYGRHAMDWEHCWQHTSSPIFDQF